MRARAGQHAAELRNSDQQSAAKEKAAKRRRIFIFQGDVVTVTLRTEGNDADSLQQIVGLTLIKRRRGRAREAGMRLILFIGVLLLALATATGEADRISQFAVYVGRAEKSSAAHLEPASSSRRGDRRKIAATPITDRGTQTLAAAEQAPVLTKNAAPPSPPASLDSDATAAPSQITNLLATTSVPAGASVSQAEPELSRNALNGTETVDDPDRHTAIYDIAAHTVYLPDGEQLEAHSGLGPMRDDPRYANVRKRGPTPPNVYALTLRSGLFHGVRAISLNPVAGSSMFSRDNILAHTYMLGPSGQSFGCVSFKDYQKFLDAFLRGEVSRMVVVAHLPSQQLVASAMR
jgi:hypothetical protein